MQIIKLNLKRLKCTIHMTFFQTIIKKRDKKTKNDYEGKTKCSKNIGCHKFRRSILEGTSPTAQPPPNSLSHFEIRICQKSLQN